MKSNTKFLCCILLSLILAFSNISAMFSFSNFNNQNQVYAAGPVSYYDGYVDIVPSICLNSDVNLSGRIYYTSCVYPDGSTYFYSINRVDTWLVGSTYWYDWIPDGYGYSYTFSPDYRTAYIKIYGTLYDNFWGTSYYIVKDYPIHF